MAMLPILVTQMVEVDAVDTFTCSEHRKTQVVGEDQVTALRRYQQARVGQPVSCKTVGM